MVYKLIKTDNYLLVVDDNKDIEENIWTVKDGKVREVSYLGQDNGYAIIAHLPLNGSPILEGVDLLPPYSRHQEDGVEELFKEEHEQAIRRGGQEYAAGYYQGLHEGYNKAREKYKYTEHDVWKAIVISKSPNEYGDYLTINDIIQSLHQYPTEFECDMEQYYNEVGNDGFEFDSSSTIPPPRPKKITNAQGVQWVGKYK